MAKDGELFITKLVCQLAVKLRVKRVWSTCGLFALLPSIMFLVLPRASM
jgi:hypothetical protein